MGALHGLGDFQAAQGFDLPLRRAGPHRIGAPDHVVGAHALNQLAEHGRAQSGLGHRALGEDLAEPADVLLSEIISSDLVTEDVVAAIEDDFDIIISMNQQAEIENYGQLVDAVVKLQG